MDEKVREKARNAIKSILEAAGFSVNTLEDPFDLAERDDEYLMVLCSNDPGEIEEYNTGAYRLMKDGEGITYKKLLFSLEPSATAGNCILWRSDEFIRYAGEAALDEILGRPLALSFSDGSRTKADAGPALMRGRSTQAIEEEEPGGIVISHLPLRVQKQAAEQIAKVQGQASLKFMPYWLYSYQSSGEQVYRDQRIGFDSEGSGGINAINGTKMDADWNAVAESAIPQSAEVVQPRLTREEATEKVVAEVIESLTRKIRIKQVIGDAISYEEKVMRPDKKNVVVQLQQAFIPVWQVRGKKIVEVNAYTGEVLSEPMDEGVEVF
ncbi:MAG: hypothetical protein A4E36_01163 [Methanoregulaceae archaeon PtaB.Bin009]|jgi:hypothetical protein|nr:MAG: hypothetical protein A4E36_01163 [Methanoregulaceae archaeon PtaB.Bin009]OPY42595.1 MAG: hypothetical protein A4E41_00202 [Methanoregulaceae archaeon PtaU1.Bin066]HNQ30274.1 hypothetical protein [Methanolinea sp.]